VTDRGVLAQAFLDRAGWGDARRSFLAGDASARRYERVQRAERTAVLMDAPPGMGEEIAPFVQIAAHLRGLGLSAPEVLAEDEARGFLLLEDLGDDVFARVLDERPELEDALYRAAVEVLAVVQEGRAPPGLPDLSAADWADAAAMALDVYGAAAGAPTGGREAFCATLTDCLSRHADGPRVMILRDYHAENLIWLPLRDGVRRVGVLDFQLAQMGQPVYDLVSLCQDARRDVAAATEAAMLTRFAERTGCEMAALGEAYAVFGAQRALRILGVFARLAIEAGKPRYLALMPRVHAQLQRNLAHPALAPLAPVCARIVPEPTPAILERIARRCAP
jgi:aminoglycoside/choline kinase family phosphotransferase